MSVLPQLEVDGPSGFDAVVGSFKAKTGIGVDAIHPSMWHTDLLNDVERTLTWHAPIQTLIYFLVPKTPTGERPIGLMPSIVRVWERVRKPILDQWMISQTQSYDSACKGRSDEMAAWQHLVLEEEQDDKSGMGRATALLDMTKCFEQVRLWHVWRWGCHWGFPRALLRIILLVFSFQRRVGLWESVSQPVTTYAAIIAGSVFSCAILHMLFIWPCDCLMSKWPRLRLTKYMDDLTISYRGMNHTVATVNTEALSSVVGWLEKLLDFHVSKDEEGVEGKSVVLVSNASLKAALTSSTKALGMRVVSHARILDVDAYGAGAARQRRTQYARLTKIKKRMPKVKFYKKYGAITSKDRQGGVHAEWSARREVHGHAADEAESLQDHGWKMLARQTRGTFSHLAAGDARVRPDTHVQSRAHCGMGRGSLGRAAGRRRSAQGLETTATTGGPEAVVEQGQWPDGCHHSVSEAVGMDMASPHDLRHCNGHEVDLRQICPRDVKAQATVDSELALWREWADNDERKELLPCPLAGTCGTGK